MFNFDLKESAAGVPCVTEINAGRFAMITNLYDLTGRHNMAASYVRLAFGEDSGIADPYDDGGENYLVRELDTLPAVLALLNVRLLLLETAALPAVLVS